MGICTLVSTIQYSIVFVLCCYSGIIINIVYISLYREYDRKTFYLVCFKSFLFFQIMMMIYEYWENVISSFIVKINFNYILMIWTIIQSKVYICLIPLGKMHKKLRGKKILKMNSFEQFSICNRKTFALIVKAHVNHILTKAIIWSVLSTEGFNVLCVFFYFVEW